jgi:hypothetical protein
MGNIYKFNKLLSKMRCKVLFKSNRSQSHVEMIVSFVLFVSFVVFLLLMFNPQKYTPVSYGSIDGVQTSLMENISVEYDYASVILVPGSTPAASTCFKIEPITGINKTSAVKNSIGSQTYSNIGDDGKITIKSTNLERFYEIYSSNFFSELESECSVEPVQLTKSEDYSLGILTTRSAVLYENIEKLNKLYYLDYDGLKKNLGIKKDFSFIIRRDEDILFDTTSKQPENINILSREIPFLSMNKTGSTENLFINLGVW